MFGSQIAILATDTLPKELEDVKKEEVFDWTESEEEEEEGEEDPTMVLSIPQHQMDIENGGVLCRVSSRESRGATRALSRSYPRYWTTTGTRHESRNRRKKQKRQTTTTSDARTPSPTEICENRLRCRVVCSTVRWSYRGPGRRPGDDVCESSETPSLMVRPAPEGGAGPRGSGKRRGRGKRWQYALTMGRTGTSSSFVLRTPRRSIKKQAAKAATRSVVLIGSHYGAGNELLKRVFGELVRPCPRVSVPTPCPRPPRVHIDLSPLTRFALRWWLLLLGSANARGWRCGASPRGAGSTT